MNMKYVPHAMLGLFLMSVALSGCNQTEKISASEVASFGDKMSYFKDAKNGLCFGVLGSTTYYGYTVTSITNVPCNQVGL